MNDRDGALLILSRKAAFDAIMAQYPKTKPADALRHVMAARNPPVQPTGGR